MVWARRRSNKDLPYGEANDRKAKLPKFEQSVFKFLELSSSNDPALYGKPVRGGTNSWLVAPLLCFESAQQLKRAASSRDKVSCRKQRRQQAAEVPHSALAARAPAPTSSLEAYGKNIQSKESSRGNNIAIDNRNKVISQDNLSQL